MYRFNNNSILKANKESPESSLLSYEDPVQEINKISSYESVKKPSRYVINSHETLLHNLKKDDFTNIGVHSHDDMKLLNTPINSLRDPMRIEELSADNVDKRVEWIDIRAKKYKAAMEIQIKDFKNRLINYINTERMSST